MFVCDDLSDAAVTFQAAISTTLPAISEDDSPTTAGQSRTPPPVYRTDSLDNRRPRHRLAQQTSVSSVGTQASVKTNTTLADNIRDQLREMREGGTASSRVDIKEARQQFLSFGSTA